MLLRLLAIPSLGLLSMDRGPAGVTAGYCWPTAAWGVVAARGSLSRFEFSCRRGSICLIRLLPLGWLLLRRVCVLLGKWGHFCSHLLAILYRLINLEGFGCTRSFVFRQSYSVVFFGVLAVVFLLLPPVTKLTLGLTFKFAPGLRASATKKSRGNLWKIAKWFQLKGLLLEEQHDFKVTVWTSYPRNAFSTSRRSPETILLLLKWAQLAKNESILCQVSNVNVQDLNR